MTWFIVVSACEAFMQKMTILTTVFYIESVKFFSLNRFVCSSNGPFFCFCPFMRKTMRIFNIFQMNHFVSLGNGLLLKRLRWVKSFRA